MNLSKLRLSLAASAGLCVLLAQPASAAKMIGYWETYGNIPLGSVSNNYDIINIAFGTPSGTHGATITFGQSVESDSQFRSDIAAKHAAGKKIVLSLGGGGAPALNLQNTTDVTNFANSVESLCSSYGFDGIDLDDESGVFNLHSGDNDFTNPTTPAIKYYIQGAQAVANHFGSSFIVSMADQVTDVDAYSAYGFDSNSGITWGSYLPIVYAMRNYNQIVETQCYNLSGGQSAGAMYARNGQLIYEGTNDLDTGMSELLLLGYHMGNGQNFPAIPQAQVCFGLPATHDGADGLDWQSPANVLNAAKYLGSGIYNGQAYHLAGGPYPNFAGVMTWDINYDQNENQGLASTLHPYLASIGGATIPEGPFGGTPAAIPGTVQAENYDVGGQGVGYNVTTVNGSNNGYRSDGVDLEVCTDTGGGVNSGWSAAGQWFRYTVNVGSAGTYAVTFRVANGGTTNATFHLQNSGGTNLSNTVTVGPTGGWQTWVNVTANVTLPAGQQVLTVSQDGGGYNLNYMSFAQTVSTENPFGGTPAAVPGTVQAENYDTGGQGVAYNVTSINGSGNGYRTDGVDLEACTDTGGGSNIGWTAAGQWFRYTVNVSTAGTYNLGFRVANGATANGTLHLQNASGSNLSGAVAVAPTGGWQTWTTVNATATLPAGRQILTVWQDSGNFNLNYVTFAASSNVITGAHTLAPMNATGTRLDNTGSNTTNGNKVEIWAASGATNQSWTFTNVGGSSYTLQVQGAHCLDSAGATTPGTQATIWACGSGNANQTWTLTPVTGGYTLKAGNSGLCLDVAAAGTANGTVVDTYTCNSTNAQTWAIN